MAGTPHTLALQWRGERHARIARQIQDHDVLGEEGVVDSLYELSLEMTRWLQAQYPLLKPGLQVMSILGDFEFYLALLPLIYWCVNKRFGKEIAYLLAVANILNAVGKHLLRQPRPFWLDAAIGLSEETSYGAPSGHVQSATVAYLLVAIRAQRRLIWFLAGLGIFLMALSRVYLGVHFWHDAILGFLLGVLILFGYYVWQNTFQSSFGNRLLGQRMLLAISLPLTIAVLYAGGLLLIGELPQVAWSEHMATAEDLSLEEVFTAGGILLGLGIGFILEATRVHFIVDGSLARRALRYLVGIAVTILIWRGLALIFPEDPQWLALPLRLFRYWLAGMWVAYYAPLLFVRTGLAQASPEPDVSLSVSKGGILSK